VVYKSIAVISGEYPFQIDATGGYHKWRKRNTGEM
jgi:hypothetical protein